MKDFPVTICGAGALGANITENLARAGFAQMRVIDRDRIEERNLSTQPYYKSDVGAYKAKMIANTLYRALGVAVDGRTKELTSANASQLLKGSAIAIDTFDNSVGRQAILRSNPLNYENICYFPPIYTMIEITRSLTLGAYILLNKVQRNGSGNFCGFCESACLIKKIPLPIWERGEGLGENCQLRPRSFISLEGC